MYFQKEGLITYQLAWNFVYFSLDLVTVMCHYTKLKLSFKTFISNVYISCVGLGILRKFIWYGDIKCPRVRFEKAEC